MYKWQSEIDTCQGSSRLQSSAINGLPSSYDNQNHTGNTTGVAWSGIKSPLRHQRKSLRFRGFRAPESPVLVSFVITMSSEFGKCRHRSTVAEFVRGLVHPSGVFRIAFADGI